MVTLVCKVLVGEVRILNARDIADERRRLAVAVAQELNSDEGWFDLWDLRVITTDDVLWLLQALPHLPDRAQPVLAACVPQVIHEPSAEVAHTILTLTPDHPAFEATANLRAPMSIESETAKRWRHQRAIETEDRDDTIPPARNRELLLDALTEAERDPEQWWRVVYWLSVEDGRVIGEALFSHDLTRRPGWPLVDEDERERVTSVGLDYIRSHELEPEHWRGRSSINSVRALRDWAGVYLLTTLTRHDAAKVHELEASIWARLAPAIVGAWNHDRDDDIRLRLQLLQLVPDAGRKHIAAASLDMLDAADTDRGLPNFPLYEGLMADIAQPISGGLLQGRYSPQLRLELLDLLAKHAPDDAIAVCHELRSRDRTDLSARAARHLANLDAPSVLRDLLTTTPTDQDVLDFVPYLDIKDLDASQLGRLARLLLDLFPFASDPPTPVGAFSPDARYKTRELRASVLNLLADLGQTDRLQRLAVDRPEPDGTILRRLVRIARSRAADLSFAPLNPDELLTLLNKSDARLVRDDNDLLEVVLEQLANLQSALTQGGAFRDLWNQAPSGITRPKSEDDISDWVRRNLQLRLDRGIIIDREVQITRPRSGGIGTRVDLAATMTTTTQPTEIARITIEAKLVNNPELMTALTDQLVNSYLEPAGRRHGIYLVYWIAPDRRPTDWSRRGPRDHVVRLQEVLDGQAFDLHPDFDIRPFLLDISPPMG